MNVGLVYRGWEWDLVSQPGYNGGVSSGVRSGSIPKIKPDQQPDDKIYNDKPIEHKQHVEPRLSKLDLGGYHYTVPIVTNFAQEIMVAEKLKQARKDLNKESNIIHTGTETRVESPLTLETTRLGGDISAFNNASKFAGDKQVYNVQTRLYGDRGRLERESAGKLGQETSAAVGRLTKHLPFTAGANRSLQISRYQNIVVADSQWDHKENVFQELRANELDLGSGPPRITLDLSNRSAPLALKLTTIAQEIMVRDKLRAGRVALDLEPGRLDMNNPSLSSAQAHLRNETAQALRDMIQFNIATEKPQMIPTDKEKNITERANGPRTPIVGHIANFGTGAVPIVTWSSGSSLGPTAPVNDHALKISNYFAEESKLWPYSLDSCLQVHSRLAELGFGIATINFDRSILSVDERTTNPDLRVYTFHHRGTINIGGPESQSQANRVQGGLSSTRTIAGAAYGGLDGSHSFKVELLPILLGLSERGEYRVKYAPILLGIDTRLMTIRRPPEAIEPNQMRQNPFVVYLERQPFSEVGLDRSYYRPDIPPETLFVLVREDNPYEHRSHYLALLTADRVPQVPKDYSRMEVHQLQVNNVHKEVNNQKTYQITENQLYGRDHSQLVAVIRLKEVVEADTFQIDIRFMEGQHTPPSEKDRKDRFQEAVPEISLETVVWGWNHAG